MPDIQALLKTKGWWTDGLSEEFVFEINSRLGGQFNRQETKPALRLSQMGPRCPCELWHMIHKPELAQPFEAWAEMKFTFGHTIEGLAIALAKAAGHEVTGEQDEVSVDGVLGHRDCVIDGCIVDVKSASSRSFQKFKDGSIGQDDMFGYLDQLDGYLVGSANDPLVRVKDRGYLLAIDKQLGHMCLYEHIIDDKSIRQRIKDYKSIVELPKAPQCTCGVVPDGESGNLKLDVKASYNSYKYCCKPSLRCFLYSDGPRYFTNVTKIPKNKYGPLVEIDKNGKRVFG